MVSWIAFTNDKMTSITFTCRWLSVFCTNENLWHHAKFSSKKQVCDLNPNMAWTWVISKLLHALPPHFVMYPRWWSSISWFSQIWLLTKYERFKKKNIHIYIYNLATYLNHVKKCGDLLRCFWILFQNLMTVFNKLLNLQQKNLKTLIAVLNFTKERKGGWGVQKCDGVTTFLIHYTQYGPNSVVIHSCWLPSPFPIENARITPNHMHRLFMVICVVSSFT
jgi:hypothetical protein